MDEKYNDFQAKYYEHHVNDWMNSIKENLLKVDFSKLSNLDYLLLIDGLQTSRDIICKILEQQK